MAAATLDRKRPFGAVIGDTEGRNFEQDGNFFRGDGTLWTEPARAGEANPPDTPALAKPAAKKAKPADPAPAAVDAQLDAQMGAA